MTSDALFQIITPLQPLLARIALHTQSNPKSLTRAPRSPRPSGTLSDGRMIPSERAPAEQESHCRTEENVETTVAVVGVAGGRNINRGPDRDED